MNRWLVLASVVALFGCGPSRALVDRDVLMEREQVVLQGFSNAVSVSAVRARATRGPGGNLHVKVQLIKQALGSEFVEIKMFFLGADGFQLESTNWEPVHLEEDVTTQHESVSLNPAAVDFRVVVRNPPD